MEEEEDGETEHFKHFFQYFNFNFKKHGALPDIPNVFFWYGQKWKCNLIMQVVLTPKLVIRLKCNAQRVFVWQELVPGNLMRTIWLVPSAFIGPKWAQPRDGATEKSFFGFSINASG